jgi:hypothetical protein
MMPLISQSRKEPQRKTKALFFFAYLCGLASLREIFYDACCAATVWYSS